MYICNKITLSEGSTYAVACSGHERREIKCPTTSTDPILFIMLISIHTYKCRCLVLARLLFPAYLKNNNNKETSGNNAWFAPRARSTQSYSNHPIQSYSNIMHNQSFILIIRIFSIFIQIFTCNISHVSNFYSVRINQIGI